MKELDARFIFLYDQLKGIYSDYTQYVFSTTTAILLVMGWLLTSEAARGYIAQRLGLKIAMTLVIVCFIVAEAWISYGAYQRSQNTVALLNDVLKNMPPTQPAITSEYYAARVVPKHGMWTLVGAHVLLYMLLALIIWLLPRRSVATPSNQPPSSQGD